MKFSRLLVTCLVLLFSIPAFASGGYEQLRVEYDKINKAGTSRQSWNSLGEKFYKLYLTGPSEKNADFLLLYAGKCYKNSYERYKNSADFDIAIKYLRIAYTNYSSTASAEAYLESAELFILKKDLASASLVLNRLKTGFPGTPHELAANSMLADLAVMSRMAGNQGTAVPAKPAGVDVSVDDVINTFTAPNDETKIGTVSTGVAVPNGSTSIKDIRYYSGKDYTRIVLDLSQNAKIEQHWLKEDPAAKLPSRLFVEVLDCVVESGVPQEIKIQDGLVKSVRWAYNRPGVPRIVLDSQSIKDFTVFQMENPARIVIDVTSNGVAVAPPAAPDRNNSAHNFSTKPTGDAKTLAEVFGLRVKTIVIDPGHGGKDPGCVYYNMKEKDIALEISLHLKKLIEKNNKDIKVYLTRDKDIFIPLEERTAIANKYKADLFISVHVNAAKNTKAKGVETYVLDVTKDRTSLELAAFENQATTKAISDLQGILKDIMLNSKLEESLFLAASVQSGIVKELKTPSKENLGVKRAPFYVLVGATMPAALVEVGFLSNKDEADKLKTTAYRQNVAKGIYAGIDNYIKKYNK